MHKVDRAADACQAAPGINSILPTVQFIVVVEGKKISLREVGFQNQAVISCVNAFDVGYITQFDSDAAMGTLVAG